TLPDRVKNGRDRTAGAGEAGRAHIAADGADREGAGPRNCADLCSDSGGGDISRRAEVEILGGDRDCGGGGGAAGVYGAAALSESPDCEFSRPGTRSAGDGISVDPVEDCGGRGRHVGQRRNQGKPDAAAVFAGAAHGFYFFGFCGRTRVRRGYGGTDLVLHFADADCAGCADGTRPCGDVRLYGCGSVAFISYTGKRRNGGREDAGNRNSPAADELRRIEHLVDIPDAGPGQQRASTKICELKNLGAGADARSCFRSPPVRKYKI